VDAVCSAVGDLCLPSCRSLGVGRRAGSHNSAPLDFAGGTVVHINSGVAALALCLVLKGRKERSMLPHPARICHHRCRSALVWGGSVSTLDSALSAGPLAGSAFIATNTGCGCGHALVDADRIPSIRQGDYVRRGLRHWSRAWSRSLRRRDSSTSPLLW